MTVHSLTQEELKSQLHYEPETGIFTWLISRKGIRKDKVAGSKNSRGYMQIAIMHKTYVTHRLAWLYMYGYFPEHCIDHINGTRDDNRLFNLREATHHENNLNANMRGNNSSGYKCVNWHKQNKKWSVRTNYKGKRYSLGSYETAQEASHAYNEFAKNNHGIFFKET
jgi:hypothetical protein